MKTINSAIQITNTLTARFDETFLSKFFIGRRISKLLKNKTQRVIFLTMWFLKTTIFYWIIS